MKKVYELLPAQREFIHVPTPDVNQDICLYQGGYGSGKTWIGTLLGIFLSKKYPGARGLAAAKTWPLVRDTTLQEYFQHFDNLGMVRGSEYIWRAGEQKIIFPQWGGSEILFRHLEEPYKLKSLNLAWAHIEEMSEVDEAVFLMLLSRLRQGGVPRHRLFGTSNPQASKGWIHHYFVENNRGVIEETGQDGKTVKIQYRRIMAPSTENIHLPPAYLKNMELSFDPEYYRINVLGEDGDYTAGLVCHSFDDLNIIETEYKPDLTIHITCDFNVDPMSWELCHQFNNEYHFFDEIVIENTNINQCIDEFCRRYPNHEGGIVLNGDASGNNRGVLSGDVGGTSFTQMLNRLMENGYNGKILPRPRIDVRGKNPVPADRVLAWNTAVCNQSGVRRVFMSPKCKWLIWNCLNLRYKPGTSDIEEPTQHQLAQDHKAKFTKHPFDAASYLIERYSPIILKPIGRKGPGMVGGKKSFGH